jgi:type II secretory pathway pseudopilin PulG
MIKRISYLLIALFILSLAIPSLLNSGNTALAQETLRVAKILETQGEVKVFRGGGEKSFAAYKGMGLTQGDTIKTGSNGKVTLEVNEDKEMKIGANTQLMISELVQSLRNNADKSSFNLKAGQVYTKVKSQLSPGAKYEIRTPTAVMGVRGTQFFVSLSNGVAEVITLEGQVVVTVSQPVTGPDGTVTMQPIQIQVEPNQIFVQSPYAADPTQYNLATLTSNENLSLFVLETLQEINEQQPDLIDPQLLENLTEQIEQARQEQQQQQQQEEQQQQQTQNRGDSSSSGSGSDSGTVDPGANEQTITISPIGALNLAVNDEETVQIHTDPEDVELSVVNGNEGVAEVSLDGGFVAIRGLSPGSTIVSITAAKAGYISATKYFTVTVYEGGDWQKSIIEEYEGTVSHTDIALDSQGMPHIIYDAGSVKYQHWNGSGWQEEEPQIGSRQGALAIDEIDENDYSFVSYNYANRLGCDRFNGETWAHETTAHEDVTVSTSSIATTVFNDQHVTGISYYDAYNGNLYFRCKIVDTWSDPMIVAGENSDAGASSSLAFDEEGQSYIAYYDYSNDRQTGSLKLAVITDPENPELIDVIEIDSQVGYGDGQYVSLAVDYDYLIHLAYYDAVNKKLKYALGHLGSDAEWLIDIVDNSAGDIGKYASLALDNAGHPHISYYTQDDSGETLKYARLDPEQEEEWLIEVVEQGEGVGRYSSIAYDSTISVPHIAYTAETNEGWAVKHATRPGMPY